MPRALLPWLLLAAACSVPAEPGAQDICIPKTRVIHSWKRRERLLCCRGEERQGELFLINSILKDLPAGVGHAPGSLLFVWKVWAPLPRVGSVAGAAPARETGTGGGHWVVLWSP